MFRAADAGSPNGEGSNETLSQTQDLLQLGNITFITDFVLIGGKMSLGAFCIEFSVFLMFIYIVVIIGNGMIFTLVLSDHKLHTPMYILLSNLSFIDIIITTCVLPKMVSVCFRDDMDISFAGCFMQMYIYLSFQSAEGFILGAMAYDRYVAICNPLRYNSIITSEVCTFLAVGAWALGLILPALSVILSTMLPYCSNKIMYWFCDYPPVVMLSCLDTTFLIDLALACAFVVIFSPFSVIIWSYSNIVLTVCKITSSEGRKKAFSTCSSHLTVVLTFYFAHLCVYISAKVPNIPPNVLILISIVNCFLTPLINPIIYSFRNKEIKIGLQKLFSMNKTF